MQKAQIVNKEPSINTKKCFLAHRGITVTNFIYDIHII
jgi:hypothetical protein